MVKEKILIKSSYQILSSMAYWSPASWVSCLLILFRFFFQILFSALVLNLIWVYAEKFNCSVSKPINRDLNSQIPSNILISNILNTKGLGGVILIFVMNRKLLFCLILLSLRPRHFGSYKTGKLRGRQRICRNSAVTSSQLSWAEQYNSVYSTISCLLQSTVRQIHLYFGSVKSQPTRSQGLYKYFKV